MEVEIMAARVTPEHQRSGSNQGGTGDQQSRHDLREVRAAARRWRGLRHGTSRRVCLVAAFTAASVKGGANVLPFDQYGHWFR
jgi:hypothetical protein